MAQRLVLCKQNGNHRAIFFRRTLGLKNLGSAQDFPKSVEAHSVFTTLWLMRDFSL